MCPCYTALQVCLTCYGAQKERFQELHQLPIGTYGQFYDKYGVQWIFRGEKEE
jgi:PhnB protein